MTTPWLSQPADSILDLIGRTPVVRIRRLNPNPRVTLFAKLEGFNPTGSIKDRIALEMIEQAEREGTLTPEKTIVEPTSGNTGIGIAMIGAVKGYRVEIVMSEAVSIERRKMIQAFGAAVTLTDAALGTDGAIMKARQLVRDFPDRYVMPDPFSNAYNQLAHYDGTAREIPELTGGRVDYFVSSLGTSGTLMGVGLALKEQSEDAFDLARRVALDEGIFAGMSSGAALFAARVVAAEVDEATIVTILPDRGEKYLSTALFQA